MNIFTARGEFAQRVALAALGTVLDDDRHRDRIYERFRDGFMEKKHGDVKIWREARDREEAARTIGRLLADELFALDELSDADGAVPPELRDAFVREARATLAANYRDRRPIVELLDARAVHVDDLLAGHYDVPAGPAGSFLAIPVGDAHPRGGILGLGTFLLAHPTADGRRAWIEATCFGGDAPDLAELHRGLAGFDAVGVWRGDEARRAALAAGRAALRARGGRFVLEVRRHLARLITGAELDPPSADAIAKMDARIAEGECPSMHGMVEGFLWGDRPLLQHRH